VRQMFRCEPAAKIRDRSAHHSRGSNRAAQFRGIFPSAA